MTGVPVPLKDEVDGLAIAVNRQSTGKSTSNDVAKDLIGGVTCSTNYSEGVIFGYKLVTQNSSRLVHFYFRYKGVYDIYLFYIINGETKLVRYQWNVESKTTIMKKPILDELQYSKCYNQNFTLKTIYNETPVNNGKDPHYTLNILNEKNREHARLKKSGSEEDISPTNEQLLLRKKYEQELGTDEIKSNPTTTLKKNRSPSMDNNEDQPILKKQKSEMDSTPDTQNFKSAKVIKNFLQIYNSGAAGSALSYLTMNK